MRQFLKDAGTTVGASSTFGVVIGGLAYLAGEDQQTIIENVYGWTAFGILATVATWAASTVIAAFRHPPAVG